MEKSDDSLIEKYLVNSGELTAEQKAGMKIAQILLWMIGGVIVLYAMICMERGCSQSRAPAPAGATLTQQLPAWGLACDVNKNPPSQLEFAFHNFQYVLNVLLPVFTTVLGYIFGTRSRG
ncbi:hypothetical protein ACQKLP_12110 [Chitinophaga sp. NPDC101104]|uniref:hypothetical protein n=1 Tax=Chitinophaga sp. NPDC101104 TaxID=3390561 RepID=UPI003CFBFFB6